MSESSHQDQSLDLSGQSQPEPAVEQLEQLATRLAAETELDRDSVENAIAVAFRQSYQGPIPSPQIVQRLNEIQPNLGTRIVEDHLEQQKHDRLMDMEQVLLAKQDSGRADRTLSLQQHSVVASFVLLFLLIACAIYLAFHGHPELAGVFLAAPLVTVIGTMLSEIRKDHKTNKN